MADLTTSAMVQIPGWRREGSGSTSVWTAGLGEDLTPLIRAVLKDDWTGEDLRSRLAKLDGHFACVVQGPGVLFAAVDRNRSIPLFYRRTPTGLRVGNCARDLAAVGDVAIDEDGLLEVRLAGFATGRKTAVQGIHQLLPGEFLAWKRGDREPGLERYYRYLPAPDEAVDASSLLDELASETDALFGRVVEVAGGRPIWIPLSGGLDSRLILCKLHELGYPALHAYSYGVPGNHEARIARTVAERLGVSWEFVPLSARMYRRFFWSPDRDAYWRTGDGLASIPALQDVAALKARAERGEIPADAIMINGQSGDYITGGHVPSKLLEPGAGDEDVVRAIISKHFSLRPDLTSSPEVEDYVDRLLRRQLDEIRSAAGGAAAPAILYEAWEWQERQCKYVVNAVRMYDFAGSDWLMPLWDGRYMRFWEAVPYRLKLGQTLYTQYLEQWDYAGLFRDFSSPRWPWPGATMAALPIGAVLGRVAGERAKEWFYDRARYFGHYRFVYGIYGWKEFLKRADVARNPVALMAETWADSLPSDLEAGQ